MFVRPRLFCDVPSANQYGIGKPCSAGFREPLVSHCMEYFVVDLLLQMWMWMWCAIQFRFSLSVYAGLYGLFRWYCIVWNCMPLNFMNVRSNWFVVVNKQRNMYRRLSGGISASLSWHRCNCCFPAVDVDCMLWWLLLSVLVIDQRNGRPFQTTKKKAWV